MKSYFTRLFNYDRYANELILKTIIEANEPEKPVQLMAHLLAAQQIWINRCLGLPPATVNLWPALGGKSDEFKDMIRDNCQAWVNYLDNLNETDFDKTISYKNLKGDSFENKLVDILTHVINHGTHHRAQIGQLLKLAGIENLPVTDYIFYIRELNS